MVAEDGYDHSEGLTETIKTDIPPLYSKILIEAPVTSYQRYSSSRRWLPGYSTNIDYGMSSSLLIYINILVYQNVVPKPASFRTRVASLIVINSDSCLLLFWPQDCAGLGQPPCSHIPIPPSSLGSLNSSHHAQQYDRILDFGSPTSFTSGQKK